MTTDNRQNGRKIENIERNEGKKFPSCNRCCCYQQYISFLLLLFFSLFFSRWELHVRFVCVLMLFYIHIHRSRDFNFLPPSLLLSRKIRRERIIYHRHAESSSSSKQRKPSSSKRYAELHIYLFQYAIFLFLVDILYIFLFCFFFHLLRRFLFSPSFFPA